MPTRSGDNMAILSDQLAAEFVKVASIAKIPISLSEIEIDWGAPHEAPRSLPAGRLAVYVFMYGDQCLKVGKAGSKSHARYCSQHYGLNAPSTLAKSLIKYQERLPIGDLLNESNVKAWILKNTERVNFLIPEKYDIAAALSLFESFLQCRLRPEFEGFASQRTPRREATA